MPEMQVKEAEGMLTGICVFWDPDNYSATMLLPPVRIVPDLVPHAYMQRMPTHLHMSKCWRTG